MFRGKVVKGKSVGRKLGFPTANLDTHKNQIDIQSGVYAANIFLNQKKYRGACVFQKEPWVVEVHLLDYVGPDFYGTILRVEPIQKISEIMITKTQKQLKEKIKKDTKKIESFFGL
ncbi:MAG: riboflavin kinase [Candidatus Magasanikbacteria bacterium]|nr:riboflavin kinase [Candidatus Magasanikbacteria bacterium]